MSPQTILGFAVLARINRWFCYLRYVVLFFAAFAIGGLVTAPFSGAAAQPAADRVALVLSIEEYKQFRPSRVPVRTGQEITDALKGRGFDVQFVKNANNAAIRAALREFASKCEKAAAAIVVVSGHVATARGRSYLLPSNAEIRRESDLLSRAIAVPSIAQIVGKAKFGAIFVFMTVPEAATQQEGIFARPALAGMPGDNIVVAFSSSDKVPVSMMDKVTVQRAADFADVAGETPLTVKALVATMTDGLGMVYGKVPDLDLTKSLLPVSSQNVSAQIEPAPPAIAKAKEQRVIQEAERRARIAEARAREAEERLKEVAKANEPPAAIPDPEKEQLDSLKVVEALFGRAQKKRIQAELKKRDLYVGPIDAVFGVLTRKAITDYQASIGATATGYLTPSQLQALIGS